MSQPKLPPFAFLPRRELAGNERDTFIARRDRLFTACTPQEQHLLVAWARWYERNDPELLTRPNVFSRAQRIRSAEIFLPLLRLALKQEAEKPPGALVRGLATIGDLIDRWEARRSRFAQERFFRHVQAALREASPEAAMGAVHVLRTLPLHVGVGHPRGGPDSDFAKGLVALTAECARDRRSPAANRLAALLRCSQWSTEFSTPLHRPRDLGLLRWHLLLARIQEDPAGAGTAYDEMSDQNTTAYPLSDMDLFGEPMLSQELATALFVSRPEAAATLMQRSLFSSRSTVERAATEDDAARDIRRILDEAGETLAEWVLADGALSPNAALSALRALFRDGDPSKFYWPLLPRRTAELLRNLAPADRHLEVNGWMNVALYEPADSALGLEAVAWLGRRAQELLSKTDGLPFAGGSSLIEFLENTVERLDDSMLSGRNWRLPAPADHTIYRIVDAGLDELVARRSTDHPERSLRDRGSLIRNAPHESLIRKHHLLFRHEFAGKARAFPEDAGLALKRIAQYSEFSQIDDRIYRLDLCKETFKELLPSLETISPKDAAVAREGKDWDTREGPFEDFDD
ncbi:hypothetical protein CDL60_17955 [Roseateles noduli]|nr:hypothetical protein CDL60_17955 [Roseateles noduli]